MVGPEEVEMKHAIAIASVLAVSMAVAPGARADDQSYLADLQAHNVPFLFGPNNMLTGGYKACGLLRNGESRDTVITQVGPTLNGFGPVIIDAAQHDLCPDTLRG
jgi:Protein of unknown function (DUF732)